MAVTLTINGTGYSFPNDGDTFDWGATITGWAAAVTTYAYFSNTGAANPLTADLNFGSSFGLVAGYFKSGGTNLASTGAIRLSVSDSICFRNNANSADLPLSVNGSDRLQFNSVVIPTISSSDTLTNKTLTSPTVTGGTFSSPSITTPTLTGSGGTLTLPAGPDTLVALATSDTLTNKTISNATNTLTGIFGPMTEANIGLSASVATNALTIALKTKAGTDPSSTDKVVIGFRNSTLTTGTYTERTVSGALSITVPASATLGQASANAEYVYVYALDNAGTVELAVSGRKIFDETTTQSSTTISSSATSGTTLYSTTGRSNVPIRLIGRLLVNEAAAGTWASTPTETDLMAAQLGAYPTIGARYTTAAGQSITQSSSTQTVVYGTKDFDTHLAMNSGTGVYTCPVAGYYRVTAKVTFSSSAWSVTTNAQINLYKNGSLQSELGNIYTQDSTDVFPKPVYGSDLVKCAAGDTLEIRVFQNNAGAKSLDTTATNNYVSIQFVGI